MKRAPDEDEVWEDDLKAVLEAASEGDPYSGLTAILILRDRLSRNEEVPRQVREYLVPLLDEVERAFKDEPPTSNAIAKALNLVGRRGRGPGQPLSEWFKDGDRSEAVRRAAERADWDSPNGVDEVWAAILADVADELGVNQRTIIRSLERFHEVQGSAALRLLICSRHFDD